jgi:tRNA-specific 2-thiouridylase
MNDLPMQNPGPEPRQARPAPGGARVVVAMSGGVDSSLAAALLVEQGAEVVGVMLRLWSETAAGVGSTNKCCSLEAVDDARRVADHLGIPFYLVNVERPFKKEVVDFTVAGYLAGETPNPCVQCNRTIRFGYLFNYAQSLGASYLATGHYARVRRQIATAGQAQYLLLRGIDAAKDQSYVLHVLTQHHLARVLFPVGELTKAEVRQMAVQRGLPVAGRHDSQDLCFVADGDYRRFLQDWAPAGAIQPGPIVDDSGRVLGQHLGLPFYTIGQRKGLGIAAGEPLYVLALDKAHNAVVVGPAEALGRDHLTARQVNWIAGEPPRAAIPVEVKIRYRAVPAPAVVTPVAGDRVHVHLARPLRDITPGQSAVLYDGAVCLGGGIIE